MSRSRISVNFNGSFSEQWNIVRGVRQGGVTSAFLFNIYINDILDAISNLKVGCKIGINRINIIAYADDMILMAPSVRSLQLLINKISLLFDEYFLKINVQKTVVMCFKRTKNCVPKNLKLYFKGHELTVVNNFKYLGCVLTSDLNDSFDIDRCSLSFTKSFGFLFRKFKSVNIDIGI